MVPVEVPGSKTEDPLNTSTFTSFPAMIAAPTSNSESTGWPMSISSEDFGTNRTRPRIACQSGVLKRGLGELWNNVRSNDGTGMTADVWYEYYLCIEERS